MVSSDPSLPSGSQLAVAREDHGNSIVLAVAGEVDLLTAPDLRRELTQALDDHPETLVVDLSKVEFLASPGLAALVGAHQRARDGTQLRLVAEGSATFRPLQLTGLDEEIPVYRSCAEALSPGGHIDESEPPTS
jgi:anti-sigma B factor antagonist